MGVPLFRSRSQIEREQKEREREREESSQRAQEIFEATRQELDVLDRRVRQTTSEMDAELQSSPGRAAGVQGSSSPYEGFATSQSSSPSPQVPNQGPGSATLGDEFDYSQLEVLEGVEPFSGRPVTPDHEEEFRLRRPNPVLRALSRSRRRSPSSERDLSPSARARRERERGSTRRGRDRTATFLAVARRSRAETRFTADQGVRNSSRPRMAMVLPLNGQVEHLEFSSQFDELQQAEAYLHDAASIEGDDGDDGVSVGERTSESGLAVMPPASYQEVMRRVQMPPNARSVSFAQPVVDGSIPAPPPVSSRLPRSTREHQSRHRRRSNAPLYRQRSPGRGNRSPTSQHLVEDRHAMSEFLVVRHRRLD